MAPAWKVGDSARPLVVHFHGAGGSGSGVLEETQMSEPSVAAGYVFIGPNGLQRGGNGRSGWKFRAQDTEGRDELMFIREVIEDARTRFHVDPSRVLLTGFSIGGSLVWYLACRAPNEFAAYAPVSGGFWVPQPETCAGPVKMLHTHGWIDRTVPLEVAPDRSESLSMRWLVSYARNRKGTPMHVALANEIKDAANNQGAAVRKRDDVHKMAQANRAFAHFRF